MARGGGIHNSLRDLQEEIKGLKASCQRLENQQVSRQQFDSLKASCQRLENQQVSRQQFDSLKASCQHLEDNVKKSSSLDELARRLDIEKVYSLLADRESQMLFWARLHFSQNGDLVPLFRHLMQSDREGDPKDVIWLIRNRLNRKDLKDELIVFGTTARAREMVSILRGLGCKVDYICRADDTERFTYPTEPHLTNFNWYGIPVISESELLEHHRNAHVVIGLVKCYAVKPYLIGKGIPADHIWRRHTQWETQYLDPEIMRPRDHEVYVDGGVLDLTNSLEFIEWCAGKYDAVYAFEPDDESYQRCLKRMEEDPRLGDSRVKLLQVALWKKDEELVFQNGNAGSSKVNDGDGITVQARSIDSVLQGAPVTFIKMDIEGAEMNALKGARESIKKWKPRLAICIYHRPEDPIEIPLYIHGLVPEYRMYIRHYSTCKAETVLYCVCDEHMR